MLGPDTLPALVGALSSSIAQGLSNDEVALYSALFTLLGDGLALVLASRSSSAGGAGATSIAN